MRSSTFARLSRGYGSSIAVVLAGTVGAACANGVDGTVTMASDGDGGGNDFLMPVTDASAQGAGHANGDDAASPGDDDLGNGDDDDGDSGVTDGGSRDSGAHGGGSTDAGDDDASMPGDASSPVDAGTDAAVDAGPDAGSECGSAGSYVPRGTACTDNGGAVCDGAGSCTQTFTVVRVGDGSAALTSASTAVFLDTFYPTASALSASSVALPIATSTTGANQAFALTGSATSEGNVTTSTNGKYLVLAGYAVAPGSASVAGSDASIVPRVVARVSASGTVDTTTTFAATIYSKDNVRSAASSDGSAFWVTGSAGGMYTIALGTSGGGTSVASAPANMRFDEIIAGQLYTTSGTTNFTSVQAIGTGVPTAAAQTATNLAGDTSGNPYGFILFDRDSAVAGVDTLYLGDASSGLGRWTFDGTTWTKDTTFTAVTSGVFGVTGWATSYGVVVLVTSAGSIARVDIPDATPDDATVTAVKSAAADTAYRGITLAAH